MKALVVIALGYALFAAAAAFLGQLFFAEFSISLTVIGVAGAVAGVSAIVSLVLARGGLIAIIASVVGILGVVANAIGYHARPHVQGNEYAWLIMALLCLAFVLIAIHGSAQLRAATRRPGARGQV